MIFKDYATSNSPLFSLSAGAVAVNNGYLYLGAAVASDSIYSATVTGLTSIGTNSSDNTTSRIDVNLDSGGAANFEGGILFGTQTSTTFAEDFYFNNSSTLNSASVGFLSGGGSYAIVEGASTASVTSTLVLNGNTGAFSDSGSHTFAGIIQDTSSGTLTAVQKTGNDTQILSGANTYTGGTTINDGTLTVGNGTSGSLTTTAALTFGGTGSFNVDEAASSSQSMGALTLTAGDATIQSTFVGTAATLTFSNVPTRSVGATANFVDSGGTATTNKIVLTNFGGAPPLTATLLDPGIFFGGSGYAAYNATTGFVRAYTSTDIGYVAATGSNAIANTSTNNVALTGNVTGQTSAAINTLNMGANTLALMGGAAFQTNGILESGGGSSSTISGGTSLSTTASGAELVIRANLSTDNLTISTPIIAHGTNALTKSGAGLLTLTAADTYTGTTYVDAGTLTVDGSSADSAAGSILSSPSIQVVNGGTLHLLYNTSTSPGGTGATIALVGTGSYINVQGSGAGQLALEFDGAVQHVQTFAINGAWAFAGIYGSANYFADTNTTGGPGYVADELYFTGDGGISVVPEPTSLSLLGFGAVALLRRRRSGASHRDRLAGPSLLQP